MDRVNFNTSNVTIQRTFPRIQHTKKLISIHLMLLFNECNSVKQPALINISIHLMLLFNVVYSSYHCCTLDFNTSNVTIQQSYATSSAQDKCISIHLMLLFNHLGKKICLFLMYFNTSNVTIQQSCISLSTIKFAFQYI